MKIYEVYNRELGYKVADFYDSSGIDKESMAMYSIMLLNCSSFQDTLNLLIGIKTGFDGKEKEYLEDFLKTFRVDEKSDMSEMQTISDLFKT